MNLQDLIKLLLELGVKLLVTLVPALSGGIWGLLLGWAVPFLAGLLYDWVERLARFNKIDAQVAADLTLAKQKQAALALAQQSTDKEAHAKALKEFASAVSALGNFRV